MIGANGASWEELVDEIHQKKLELPADAPLERVLESLIDDAGRTWGAIAFLSPLHSRVEMETSVIGAWSYRERCFGRYLTQTISDSQCKKFAERFGAIVAELESGSGLPAFVLRAVERAVKRSIPEPRLARRLRVVTGFLPSFLAPLAQRQTQRGIADDPLRQWTVLMMIAAGAKPDNVAVECAPVSNGRLRFPFSRELARHAESRRRNALDPRQVWRVRRRVIRHLASVIEPLLPAAERAAA